MHLTRFSYARASARWSVDPLPALDSPATLVIAFGAAELRDDDRPFADLRRAFPRSVVIGCSTAGEIDGARGVDDSITAAAIRFEHTRVVLAKARLPTVQASFQAGTELADQLRRGGDDLRAVLVVPIGLLLAYGALRLSTTLLTELRELIFAKATEGAARSISLQVFRQLHALSLRFHLERQTGGMTRDIERGTRAVHSLISYSLYSIIPTLIEVALVLTLLAVKFDAWFAWITLTALVFYIAFTVTVTNWRTQFRKQMNELDSKPPSKAIDSLLNYETVKYYNH